MLVIAAYACTVVLLVGMTKNERLYVKDILSKRLCTALRTSKIEIDNAALDC